MYFYAKIITIFIKTQIFTNPELNFVGTRKKEKKDFPIAN